MDAETQGLPAVIEHSAPNHSAGAEIGSTIIALLTNCMLFLKSPGTESTPSTWLPGVRSLAGSRGGTQGAIALSKG